MTGSVQRGHQLALIAVLVGLLLGGIALAVVPNTLWVPAEPTAESADAVDPAAELCSAHTQGHTGTDVRIGVIDATGIDTSNPVLAGRLSAVRTFGDTGGLFRPTRDRHGTAAASVVAQTAPDSELYFASIDDEDGFEAAVEWLLDEEVDVIVTSVSFYGKPGDGETDLEETATRATKRGTVVVAPSGNLGTGYWQSRFFPTESGHQRYGDTDRNRLDGDRETLTLWLSWNDPVYEFTLELYREGERIAQSHDYTDDSQPNQRLVTTIHPDVNYSFTISGSDVATGKELRVESPTHRFEHGTRTGSIVPPGTARGVVTVGAHDSRTGVIEPYSGAGPTADGRTGVDVVAPSRIETSDGHFQGTSASAPYVAGVIALVLDANGELGPGSVDEILAETSDDGLPYDDRAVAGYGRLQPEAAIAEATNATGDD